MSTLVLTIRNERGRMVTSKLGFSVTRLGKKHKLASAERKRNDRRETIHIRLGNRKGKFSVTIQEKNSFDKVVQVTFPGNVVTFNDVSLRSKWQIPPVTKIAGKRKSLLLEYLKRKKLGEWKDLTEEEQTTYLAITTALSQVHIGSETALDQVKKLQEIAGDPSGKRHSATVFRLYTAQTHQFKEWIESGARFKDTHGATHKTISAPGHKGYPKSRKTRDGVPNLQWAYTENHVKADIDLDGKRGLAHLSRENSDVRAWYSRFRKKYGSPGFVPR